MTLTGLHDLSVKYEHFLCCRLFVSVISLSGEVVTAPMPCISVIEFNSSLSTAVSLTVKGNWTARKGKANLRKILTIIPHKYHHHHEYSSVSGNRVPVFFIHICHIVCHVSGLCDL